MALTALYFGSFNPLHLGHLAVAQYAVQKGFAEEVWLVVSPHNPHKSTSELAPEEERLEMARRAVEGIEGVEVCDVEFSLPRPSYTINTIDHLKKLYPEREFAILGGGDVAATIATWREGERLVAENRIFIYPRGENDDFEEPFRMLEGAPMMTISSTEVRRRIADGGEWESLVPQKVMEYIKTKRLYMENTIEQELALGKEAYAKSDFGAAKNHFGAVLRMDAGNCEAEQWLDMIEEILAFRHKDYYNP
ncbi:MAG: nicotinate (nicotinamide) nucleotide adenylyltransferase [Tidjanibacter sp.]|nr:nicotinate (nicotinamide) nucleotide adenylyltransferase [Tidjanibacter sp.]